MIGPSQFAKFITQFLYVSKLFQFKILYFLFNIKILHD